MYILYGMVGGKEISKRPKQKVTLGQTLCEPQSGTNNDINENFVDGPKAGTREATVAGWLFFSRLPPRPRLPPSCSPGQGWGWGGGVVGVTEGRGRAEGRNLKIKKP